MGSRNMTCKRCGGRGHMSKKCPAPPVEGGRPDFELLNRRIKADEVRAVSDAALRAILNYVEQVETHRRVLIMNEQRRLAAPKRRPEEQETELAAVRKRYFRLARHVIRNKSDVRVLVDIALEEASSARAEQK